MCARRGSSRACACAVAGREPYRTRRVSIGLISLCDQAASGVLHGTISYSGYSMALERRREQQRGLSSSAVPRAHLGTHSTRAYLDVGTLAGPNAGLKLSAHISRINANLQPRRKERCQRAQHVAPPRDIAAAAPCSAPSGRAPPFAHNALQGAQRLHDAPSYSRCAAAAAAAAAPAGRPPWALASALAGARYRACSAPSANLASAAGAGRAALRALELLRVRGGGRMAEGVAAPAAARLVGVSRRPPPSNAHARPRAAAEAEAGRGGIFVARQVDSVLIAEARTSVCRARAFACGGAR